MRRGRRGTVDAVIKRGVHPIWRDRCWGLAVRCYVCEKETPLRQRYCDRCRVFFMHRDEKLKRRAALRKAYDRDDDCFRCHWSGVILEERDINDPFHLCFDHLIPVKASELVVSSELFNVMKTELAPSEFHIAIEELAAHRAGEPFDQDRIEFVYWRMKAPYPPGLRDLRQSGRDRTGSKGCVICGKTHRTRSPYCPRCRAFVQMHCIDNRVRARAMKAAWSAGENGFLCYYTGVKLDDGNPNSPWFLTFDHRVPGNAETIVVSAWWVNAMKSALSEDEFWKVVKELDACWKEKREFNKNIVPFDYWRRKRRR